MTTNTLAGNKTIEVPISDTYETVWIYVDECTEVGDDVRSAKIKLTVLLNGAEIGTTEYHINQRKLFPVTYKDENNTEHTYYIEYHEEYLHDYDVEDQYGQTEYEGMQWGLNGTKISEIRKQHIAVLLSKGGQESYNKNIKAGVAEKSTYYDFYLPSDVNQSLWYFENGTTEYNQLVHIRQGQHFSEEIVSAAGIEYNNLATSAESAVQYCYNKNKRNADGTITQNWYLPAIDEIEEIVMSKYGFEPNKYDDTGSFTYSRFEDFRQKFYWSSQPAYKRNYVFVDISAWFLGAADRWGIYMVDNEYYARATSVSYENRYEGGASNYLNYSREPSGIISSGKTNTEYYNQYIKGTAEYYISLTNLKLDSPKDVVGGENYSGSNSGGSWNHTLQKVTDEHYEKGYKARTSYARVRCVRKK